MNCVFFKFWGFRKPKSHQTKTNHNTRTTTNTNTKKIHHQSIFALLQSNFSISIVYWHFFLVLKNCAHKCGNRKRMYFISCGRSCAYASKMRLLTSTNSGIVYTIVAFCVSYLVHGDIILFFCFDFSNH